MRVIDDLVQVSIFELMSKVLLKSGDLFKDLRACVLDQENSRSHQLHYGRADGIPYFLVPRAVCACNMSSIAYNYSQLY